jgi:hypothetical protein
MYTYIIDYTPYEGGDPIISTPFATLAACVQDLMELTAYKKPACVVIKDGQDKLYGGCDREVSWWHQSYIATLAAEEQEIDNAQQRSGAERHGVN